MTCELDPEPEPDPPEDPYLNTAIVTGQSY
jgi:hypothetical protein